MDAGCIVLAGGKGSRLGRDKVLETIGSKSLLERVVSCLSPICKDIIIVTARERDIPITGRTRLRMATDIFPGKGPLVGIYTGLTASDYSYNLVVASDMPFLNKDLLRYMVQVAPGYDVAVPRVGDLVEPLHAVYSKTCIPVIEGMLGQNRLGVNELLTLVKVRYIEAEEIDRFDPRHVSFFNVNTRADMETARELARGITSDDNC